MKIRELFGQNIFVAITNEEAAFLKKHKDNHIIDLPSLEERDSRIAENLIFKDILYKINNTEAMVKRNVRTENPRAS
jgi:hypothetical protein